MQLNDAVIVVTGGGSGIGAALCERFAAESPSAVVVVDIDEAAASTVRDRIGHDVAAHGTDVWHAGCDVSDQAQVEELIRSVEHRNGPIDLFCANAGIGSAAGVEADTDVWQRMWDVNVMAHVHAARALLPGWCERGSGHLLVTASAAGLLSNLGDAPYSVTKHGAVALAEWISITYGDRGVGVSCLCPQGVRTPLLFGALDRADTDGVLAAEVVTAQRILEPAEVAETTVEALERDDFLILPHAEVAGFEQARAADRGRWLAAMRRLQARISGH